ncbi:hypothetical protein FQN51_004526 [Onygenales sp. PD_10]|nr:hypothetical protein FQN51_004526 [Onygenales sp. PD_10]
MAAPTERSEDGYLLDVVQGPSSLTRDGVEYHGGLSTSQTYHVRMEKDTLRSISTAPKKRYFITSFMITLYSILLLLSWIITVVLSAKPLNGRRWHASWTAPDIRPCHYSDGGWGTGFGCDGMENIMTEDQLGLNESWRKSVRFIGSVMAVAAIPVSSAICARAAVAYLQNKENGTFRLSEAITLANRAWWDPILASKLLHPQHRQLHFSKFLLLATSVCALGATIWPLQAILVTDEAIPLVLRASPSSWNILTHDADISGLSQVNSTDVIITTKAAINTGTYWDSQPNLWITPDSMCNGTSNQGWSRSCETKIDEDGTILTNMKHLLGESSFVSYATNTADTGLFEGHSFRFNSSVKCTNVTEDMFPQPCNGFTAAYVTNGTNTDGSSKRLEFQVCAPGDPQRFAWSMTRDRQDIEEEVYLRFNDVAMSSLFAGDSGLKNSSLTQRCTSRTSAGYFMLPNRNNGHAIGPLLDTFDLLASHDPQMVFENEGQGHSKPPSDMILGDAYPIPPVSKSPALGPLLTATISLFGPSTFFSTRANATSAPTPDASTDGCIDPVPFYYISRTSSSPHMPDYIPQSVCASNSPSDYQKDLNNWLSNLFLADKFPEHTTEDVFTQAVFHANKATLSRAAAVERYRRMLLTDSGVETRLLRMSTAAIVVISIVIFLHLAGLMVLAYSASKNPTWTETLDAFAILKLGLQLKANQPEEPPVWKAR